MKRLLHIGCGPKRLQHLPAFFHNGWEEIRLDIDPAVEPDIVASIVDLSGVDSDAYDAVWSSHNIEHLFHHEAISMLTQLRRVLKPDGWCVVTCPDIRTAMAFALEHGLDAPMYQSAMGPISARDMLYGHMASIQHGNEFMAHKNGFDLNSMAEVFRAAGYPRFYGEREGTNLWFIGGGFASGDVAKAQLTAARGL